MSQTIVWELAPLPGRNARSLTTFEAYKTIDQIAALEPQRLVISGADALARNDVPELIEYARRRKLDPALHVSPARALTSQDIAVLRQSGLTRLLFDINGSSPQRDVFFGTTVRAMRFARDAGLKVEVNTRVDRRSIADLAAIAEAIDSFHIDAWNVYFLVPLAGVRKEETISAEQAEHAFAALSAIASLANYRVRTVEAPQYRRYLMQQASADPVSWADFSGYVANSDVLDDIVFVTSEGDVRPSEFLPLSGGNLRYRSLSSIVGSGDLFVALRDRSNLGGKCGRCEYRHVCGGSRARAWAVSGDLFASDPLCAYQPRAMEVAV